MSRPSSRHQNRPAGPAGPAGAAEADFVVSAHRAQLMPILEAISVAEGPLDAAALDGLLRRHPRAGRGFFSRAEIIEGFRALGGEPAFGLTEADFVARVQLRPVRTQSGVTPLTVLTRPHPCPGRCIFCPNDVRMPKSYLSDEPGAQRAASNHFDPYLQTWNRLAAYRAIGHPTEKVELIVLGGTWSFHPEPYQIWFAKRCFDALNDFGAGRDGRAEVELAFEAFEPEADTRAAMGGYNKVVGAALRDRLAGELLAGHEAAGWGELEAAQRENETARCRSVGFVVETRPDHIDEAEVLRIRRLGCTKVQIGLQSLDDAVLAANHRGHDLAASRRAMALLRRAGFKIHAHWMPNLHGATPQRDKVDFARLWEDPDFRPDELKIYPCSLIETAELMTHYERGEWRPYTHEELLDVLTDALGRVPRYCRVTRVIRDISSDDIVVGNKLTNFRQIAEQALAREQGRAPVDIRAREIKRARFDPETLELRETRYGGGVSEECFLEFVTPEDRIVGFLRLSLPEPSVGAGLTPELSGAALIREVHVYGVSLGVGARPEAHAQHRGLGQELIEAAVARAREAGYAKLSVISAIGTRPYYRKLGFVDGVLYQTRRLA